MRMSHIRNRQSETCKGRRWRVGGSGVVELLLPLNVTDAAVSLAGTLTQGVPCSVTATAGDVSVSGSVTAQAGLVASAPTGNGIVNAFDLAVVLNDWGNTSRVQSAEDLQGC